MALKTAISVEEYLRTSYEVAPDYIEGELHERTMPSSQHSNAQAEIVFFVRQTQEQTGLHANPEIHMRIEPGRYRVADMALFYGPAERGYPSRPPIAVIEISSPNDSHSDLMARMRDYERWGVPYIWLADPDERTLHRYRGGSLQAVDAIEIPEHRFLMPAARIFGG